MFIKTEYIYTQKKKHLVIKNAVKLTLTSNERGFATWKKENVFPFPFNFLQKNQEMFGWNMKVRGEKSPIE